MEGNGVEGTNPFAALPTEQSEDATSIQETRHANDTGITTATANDDDEDNDHDLDSQVDDSSSDVESENGVEPPPESFDAPVMVLCPFPGCASDDPEKESELPAPFTKPRPLVAHLETAHGLHVRNLHHMYFSLQRYLDHYAAMMRANNDGKPVADGHLIWTIDPDQCHDDLTFRRELQREKLNEILQVQEKERQEDGSVPRKCLFCKVIPENRHLLFKHMFQEHGFNIGLPDNLVEVEEFLNLLSAKLTNRQCLYCEKIFTTPAVLRKHMRKKKHFKISARNRIYDKYYVINYLEPGLNWETLEYEKYESDEERRNDDDWDDWDEPDVEPTQCLFCDSIDESPEGIIEHMTSEHQFNLVTIREEHDLDFYKTVTLINFIRERSAHCTCMGCATSFDTLDAMVTHMKDNDCFNKLPGNDNDIWKDPKYLFPTVENDPLLMWVDDADEMEEVQVPVANNTATEHAILLVKKMKMTVSRSF
ncbi:hypothetical protein BDF22DRAFT_622446 [Syncephalis plumigaleata]|nr:hypothetical protein BDF22DRAFT_622446 [Syncephalis plumigaleata]